MIVTLCTERIRSLDDIRAFLGGSEGADIAPHDREAAYAFIERTLVRFRYHFGLSRAGKGLVRKYVAKVTGYSDAQLTRLIRQQRRTVDRFELRHPHQQPLRSTRVDIAQCMHLNRQLARGDHPEVASKRRVSALVRGKGVMPRRDFEGDPPVHPGDVPPGQAGQFDQRAHQRRIALRIAYVHGHADGLCFLIGILRPYNGCQQERARHDGHAGCEQLLQGGEASGPAVSLPFCRCDRLPRDSLPASPLLYFVGVSSTQ